MLSTTGPAAFVIKAMHRHPEENGVFPFDEGSVKALERSEKLIKDWMITDPSSLKGAPLDDVAIRRYSIPAYE